MKTILSVLAGLIILALAIIGVQNPTLITIRFLGWQTGVLPLWVIIVAALASGLVLGGVLTIPGRITQAVTTRRLRHRLADAQAPVDGAAPIPEQTTASLARPISTPPLGVSGRVLHPPSDDGLLPAPGDGIGRAPAQADYADVPRVVASYEPDHTPSRWRKPV